MAAWIQYQGSGTVTFTLPERPDASPTFAVRSPGGGSLETGTGTRESVDTTLNGAVAAGAESIIVTSASGITVGRRYMIGTSESAGGEFIVVKSISGTTITPVRPLWLAHATGVGFQSTRVDCAVSSTGSATIGRFHRVDLTYLVGTAARPVESQTFDVTRYTLTRGPIEDLRTLDGQLARRVPKGTWLPHFVDTAWDILVARVAAQKDPGGLVGTLDMTVPHQYLVRELLAEQAGDDYAKTRELMAQRFNEEFASVMNAHAFDDNQDGRIEPHEGFRRTVNVRRG